MLLANEFRVLYESPDPATVFAYSPGICRLASGRLVATMDQGGPGVKDLSGPKGLRGEGKHAWQIGIVVEESCEGGRHGHSGVSVE